MSELKVKKPSKIDELKAMSPKDRNRAIGDLIMNNAMFIIIAIAVVGIAIAEPSFLSVPSIVNIISLTAAKLPIALVSAAVSSWQVPIFLPAVRWVWLPPSLPACS